MRICLLDMGRTKYGDCILVEHLGVTILIDGAHPQDSASVLRQLSQLLGHRPPFEIDLLVVTHCHGDHIGCLPALIDNGDLSVRTALVADERLGFGRSADGSGPIDALQSNAARGLAVALQEEDYSNLPDAELRAFLEDAENLEERYGKMLKKLADEGTNVIRHGRDSSQAIASLAASLRGRGLTLKVLGPTQQHILRCAETIAAGGDAAADAVARCLSDDASAADLVAAYRHLRRPATSDEELAADRFGPSAAKNDQSIVLSVAADGWKALLAGDMQFAKAEVADLDELMRELRGKVTAETEERPYGFVKLAHHTSYNAFNQSVLDDWPGTKLLAHSGGSNDSGHPDPANLDLLRNHAGDLELARTDRNGIITVEKVDGELKMLVQRGRLNDFTPNRARGRTDIQMVGEANLEKLVAETVSDATDAVQVLVKIPHRSTKVSLSIGVDPGPETAKAQAQPAVQPRSITSRAPTPPVVAPSTLQLAGGRRLPKLLFVTCVERLRANMGEQEAGQALQAIRDASQEIVEIPASVSGAAGTARLVRSRLQSGQFRGVVLLGGFDVVPANSVDVLDPELRDRLQRRGLDREDADRFIVWSDEIYGDTDGDSWAELPVSRIPDGRRADVVFAAMRAGLAPNSNSYMPSVCFGVRNVQRPFADPVYASFSHGQAMERSEPFGPANVPPNGALGAVYYMLHGSARDATCFWGERSEGGACETFTVGEVPPQAPGSIVFTGCCWGALTAGPPAASVTPSTPLRPRGPEASIAVAYLKAGALAYVGCTGSHYSPSVPPFDYFGKPMHWAFWEAIQRNCSPAEALFLAKRRYAADIPHGQTDPFSQAVERKILRQYVCLGLGW